MYSEHVADETTADMEMILKDKIQRLLGFFQVLKQDITQVEKAVLDATLRQVYNDAGVHDFPNFRDVPSTSYPILSDVYEALSQLKETDADRYGRIEDFHYILESYVNGSKTIFNGHTNINLQSDLLSFDLKPLQNEAEVQGAAYLNTFSYLWDNITENTEENVKLFVDEFHFLTQNPDAASFSTRHINDFVSTMQVQLQGPSKSRTSWTVRWRMDKTLGKPLLAIVIRRCFSG